MSTLESNVVPTLTPTHRFLFVNDLTLPLIRMLQRYRSQHLPSLAGDLKTLFPRLAVVVTEEFCKGDGYHQPTNSHPVYVTLYRTLPFATLMHACNPYTGWGSDITVNFFGTYQSNRAKVAEEDTSNRFRYIDGLIIKPGARITGGGGIVGSSEWKGTWVGTSFTLHFEDGVSLEDAEETMGMVLDHLALYVEGISKGKDVSLYLRCTAAVLERFIEIVSATSPNLSMLFTDRQHALQYEVRQPLFLFLYVEVTTPCDIVDMQDLSLALANVYSLHWRHCPLLRNNDFVDILAPAVDLHLEMGNGDWIPPAGEGFSYAVQANLVVGNAEHEPPTGGFHARGLARLLYNRRSEHSEETWSEPYPLSHIPLVQPTPDETRNSGQDLRRWRVALLRTMARRGLSSLTVGPDPMPQFTYGATSFSGEVCVSSVLGCYDLGNRGRTMKRSDENSQ